MADNIEPTNIEEHHTWAEVGGLEADYFTGDYPESTGHRGVSAGLVPDQAAPVYNASSPQELRALWVTRWDFRTAEDIRIIAERAADANFNALFFQVRGNADALYRSQIEPWSALLSGGTLGEDPGWDPLELAINEAHARGLELHAWVNVYPAWLGETAPPSVTPEQMYNSFNSLYDQEWLMWNRHQEPMTLNKEYLWSNPGHFAVLKQIVAVAARLGPPARVRALVLAQVARVHERRRARAADVAPVVEVAARVRDQAAARREARRAHGARVRSFAAVREAVLVEVLLRGELRVAVGARVGANAVVHVPLVPREGDLLLERRAAARAAVRPRQLVRRLVPLEVDERREARQARVAHERLALSMKSLVLDEVALVLVRLAAADLRAHEAARRRVAQRRVPLAHVLRQAGVQVVAVVALVAVQQLAARGLPLDGQHVLGAQQLVPQPQQLAAHPLRRRRHRES